MSELGVVEKIEAEEKPVEQPKPKFSRDDWEARQVEKASKSGWKDFDDYVEEGGDPDKWKTADAFNLFGEMASTSRRKDQEFNQRIDGLHKLTQAQLSAQREKILAEREVLIDEGGRGKDVKALDKQLDSLSQQSTNTHNPADSFLNDWNANNAWIFEDSPKAVYAKAEFTKAVAAGKSVEAAVEAVESAVKKHFAPAPKAGHVPESEKGRGSAGFGVRKGSLTMADLNDDEKLAWKAMSHAWKDQKEFLQAVADDRKSAGRGERA